MNIISRHTALWLALSVGVGFCLQASDASAYIESVTTGTGSCKPSTPARAAAFLITNFYTQNNSTTNEYLVCSVPQWLLQNVNTISTDVYFTGTTAGGTVLCTAQSGYSFGGVFVGQAHSRTVVMAPGLASGYISFPALLRPQPYYTVAFTCRIPPGFKLGLIVNVDPDPPGGYP